MFYRFLYCSESLHEDITVLDENLFQQVNNTVQTEVQTTVISHITEMPHSTCKEQFILLSSISNYHWIENVALFTNKTFKSKNRFSNHMIYFIPQDEGTKCQKHHIPTSPRNRLMHMLLDENYELSICDVIKHLLHFDQHPHDHMAPSPNDENAHEPPQKKTRRQAPKVVSVLPTSVCKEIGVDYNAILNSAKEQRSMYTNFQEELLLDGTIKWHLHSQTTDICVMMISTHQLVHYSLRPLYMSLV